MRAPANAGVTSEVQKEEGGKQNGAGWKPAPLGRYSD